MKKISALVAIALVAITLTGCDRTGEPGYESHNARIDRLYAECLAVRGSFEYNASLPYFNCEVRK